MMSDRSAIAAARRSMAWNTGSKAARSQWVVVSWYGFMCCSGFGMVLGARVVEGAGVGHVVVVVVVVIGKSSSAAAAAASLAVGFFGWCFAGALVGLLSCVGIRGVGKNVAGGGIIVGKSLSVSFVVSLWASLLAVD